MEKKFELGPIQKKWIASLKAHPERQLKNVLGNGTPTKYQACCLGELGLIAGICEFNKYGIIHEKGFKLNDAELNETYSEVGLNSDNGSIKGDYRCLALLNDDEHHTWPEIAYLVEAAPELFFNKSV